MVYFKGSGGGGGGGGGSGGGVFGVKNSECTFLRLLFMKVIYEKIPFGRFWEILSACHGKAEASNIFNVVWVFVYNPMKILNSSPLWALRLYIFKSGKLYAHYNVRK